jgi:hypothetical protein
MPRLLALPGDGGTRVAAKRGYGAEYLPLIQGARTQA